jgi:hypothetical protein
MNEIVTKAEKKIDDGIKFMLVPKNDDTLKKLYEVRKAF